MKNQYFGDINDFRKYGILRALQANTELRLLLAWMLTPDDGGSDGELRSYLQKPDRWKGFDLELFAGLTSLLLPGSERAVSLIETTGLLARTSFFSKLVPDRITERDLWRTELVAAAAASDLVFLDPDNGIEVPSKPIGSRNSSKYLARSEIQALWSAGCSLLIYQHFPREDHNEFTRRQVAEVKRLTGASFVEAILTLNVVFLLVSQPRHENQLRIGVQRLSAEWTNEIRLAGFLPDQHAK